MPAEDIYETIAARQVSLALVVGIVGFAALMTITIVFQWSHMWGFDLTQSFTDTWLWILFTGSGVCLTLINYGIWRRISPKKTQEPKVADSQPVQPTVPDSERSQTGLNDLATSQLWQHAKMGFLNLLKLNLKLIGEELNDGRIPPKFKLWDVTDPELKKHLVTNSEYDALDDFAKSLTQCPRRDEPDFDVMSNLCKNHYERLKRLGLVELRKTSQ